MRTPLSRVTGRSAEGAAAEAVVVWLPEAPRDRVLPSLHRHSRCAGSLVTPPVESRHQEEAASQMRGGGTRPSQAHPLLAPWGFVALPMPAWGRSGLTMAGQLRWGAHGRRARVVTRRSPRAPSLPAASPQEGTRVVLALFVMDVRELLCICCSGAILLKEWPFR